MPFRLVPSRHPGRRRRRYRHAELMSLLLVSAVLAAGAGLMAWLGVSRYLAQRDGIPGVVVVSSCRYYNGPYPFGCEGEFHASRGHLVRPGMTVYEAHGHRAGERLPALLPGPRASQVTRPKGGPVELAVALGLGLLELLFIPVVWLRWWRKRRRDRRAVPDLFS